MANFLTLMFTTVQWLIANLVTDEPLAATFHILLLFSTKASH